MRYQISVRLPSKGIERERRRWPCQAESQLRRTRSKTRIAASSQCLRAHILKRFPLSRCLGRSSPLRCAWRTFVENDLVAEHDDLELFGRNKPAQDVAHRLRASLPDRVPKRENLSKRAERHGKRAKVADRSMAQTPSRITIFATSSSRSYMSIWTRI